MKIIRKTGEVLRCFTATQPEHSTSQIARSIGNSSSGTHDLVDSLAQIGLLRKTGRGRYRLGPLVATLYRALEDSSALIEAARPVMDALAATHRETLHLTMHDHGHLLVKSWSEGTRPLRVSADIIGPWLELDESPAGLLHLSALSHTRLEAWLDDRQRRGQPIASPSRFRSDLAALAKAGFAQGPIARHEDIICTAALVHDHTGQVIAVLSMSVPETRFSAQPRAFRGLISEAAGKISCRLGFGSPG